ncbi:MAG: hypothetical protein WC683_19510 [bacterium]
MKKLAKKADPGWPDWPQDYVSEAAYLVARGVRPMAIVGSIRSDKELMLRAASSLEIISLGEQVVAFVTPRDDGFADCGFAAARWVVDLYAWLVKCSDVPEEHAHRIRGLLLGYSAGAIRDHDERGSGRRFTDS